MVSNGLILRISIFAAISIAAIVAAWIVYPSPSTPVYARVAFGSDSELQLGFVAEGKRLYVDEQLHDGIQPAQYLGDTRANLSFEFRSKDNNNVYRNITVSLLLTPEAINDLRPQVLYVDLDVVAQVPFSLSGSVNMSDREEDAGLLQFHKPLTIRIAENSLPSRLVAGGPSKDLRVSVGSTDQGGQSRIIVSTTSRTDGTIFAFDDGVSPLVEIEFPADKDGEPIIEKFALDAFC